MAENKELPAPDSEKLHLEMAKLSLENQKLAIELRRLHHPWLPDPDTLFRLVTGVVVLLGAIGTIYYTGLKGTVDRLRSDKEQLTTSIGKLEAGKQKLEGENASLSKTEDLLRKKVEHVELESEIQLLRQNARLRLFPFSDPDQSPELQPIVTVIRYVQNHSDRREDNISFLETIEAETKDLPQRVALRLALFGITGMNEIKQRGSASVETR